MTKPMRKTPVRKTADMETETEYDISLNQIASTFAEGFISNMFGDGIQTEVSSETLLKYLSEPDNYVRELEKLANYYYITTGDVFQLFDLTRILPTLNHKITVLNKEDGYEENLRVCNKALNKIKHKQLTRDIISQLISAGTLTGIWLGTKKKPYLYLFDRPDKVFPAYRLNGEWVVQIDLSWLDELDENERDILFKNLSPYLKKSRYDEYKKDTSKNQYVDLPQDRTVCLRTHTLNRNQRFGVNWSTTGLFDIQHKKKLKDLEKAVANKIISAIAVLTIGNDKIESQSNLKLNPALKKNIYAGVRAALEKNQSKGVTVVGIPDFAKIEFPEMKSDALEPKKFDSINHDISSSYGISNALTNGTSANNSSAKINLEVFYKRIGVILEDIETEVYRKLFDLILPADISDEYILEYDKEQPLTLKEKVDILMKLHVQEGFSLKAVVDCVPGIDFTDYYQQSIYELETLKLQDKIKPYASAFIGNMDNEGAGRPTVKEEDKQGNPTE
ncbi:hypothetical protein ACH6EH_06670 [Paenibacillus sp. JSM ZJ436]|uniref:hypothetical protein n=1 Tax=Paenibacillus sp. JSM ZJ436 TaxID=3376190 RepID=UPI00378DB5D2